MKKVSLDDVRSEPNPLKVHEVRKPLSKVLKTTDFAMNYFELDTGESFSGGIHTHHDQEEVFYVIEGTATFEVTDGPGEPRETVEVGADEAIRFPPGQYQVGRNEGDELVRGFALGAPGNHDFEEIESLLDCPECGRETGHSTLLVDGRFEIECLECGHQAL